MTEFLLGNEGARKLIEENALVEKLSLLKNKNQDPINTDIVEING